MIKKAIIILNLALITSSCGQATKKQEATTENADTEIQQKFEFPFDTIEVRRTIKYFFQANGGAAVFFDDGMAFTCPRCELVFYDTEKLEHLKPHSTYKEFPTYLLLDEENKWELYDDFGCITIDWVIVNYHLVKSPYQITNFQAHSHKTNADSIQTINETCLITIMPETKEFEDEDSEEADAYFTAMDDWAYYNYETCKQFEEIGIKNVVAKKKYLLFTLNANEQIVVNTQDRQNDQHVSILLYKKGHIPIFVYPIIGDNDMEIIDEYLKK